MLNEDVFVEKSVLDREAIPVAATESSRSVVKHYWHCAATIGLAILLWIPRLTGPIDLRWDAGVYYVLGTSLATGHGYRILSEPGSPEALQYPPLLPAVVALYERALGSTDPAIVGSWLRISYAALFLVYALAVLALARRYLRPIYAFAATTLCLLHQSTIFFSDALFAELPFSFIAVVFALAATGRTWSLRLWLREAGSFALSAMGFLLRTAGVVLFAAWVIDALIHKRWRLALARVVLALVPIILWQAHVERVHRSDEYSHPAYSYQRAPYQFYNVSYADNALLVDPSRPELGRAGAATLARRVATNFPYVAKATGEAVSAISFHWRQTLFDMQDRLFGRQLVRLGVVIAPILLLVGLILFGLVMLGRRGAWLFVFYVIGSIGLICTTPWGFQFERYVVPIAPFLTIAVLLALSGVATSLPFWESHPRIALIGRVMLGALLALTFFVQLYTSWRFFAEREHEGASFVPGAGMVGPRFFHYNTVWRGWDKAIAWIQQNSAPDAIIATLYSHLCYLRTGKHAVSLPIERDPVRARRLLESVPASYVIVDSEWSLPTVESDSRDWHLAQSFDGTKLYEHTPRQQ
jgi:hypothetical protein